MSEAEKEHRYRDCPRGPKSFAGFELANCMLCRADSFFAQPDANSLALKALRRAIAELRSLTPEEAIDDLAKTRVRESIQEAIRALGGEP